MQNSARDVVEARFAAMPEGDLPLEAFMVLSQATMAAARTPLNRVNAAALDKLRFAVTAYEDRLYRKAALFASEAVEILENPGTGPFVGDRGTFTVMALQQRVKKLSA